jgi:hypothetical protein
MMEQWGVMDWLLVGMAGLLGGCSNIAAQPGQDSMHRFKVPIYGGMLLAASVLIIGSSQTRSLVAGHLLFHALLKRSAKDRGHQLIAALIAALLLASMPVLPLDWPLIALIVVVHGGFALVQKRWHVQPAGSFVSQIRLHNWMVMLLVSFIFPQYTLFSVAQITEHTVYALVTMLSPARPYCAAQARRIETQWPEQLRDVGSLLWTFAYFIHAQQAVPTWPWFACFPNLTLEVLYVLWPTSPRSRPRYLAFACIHLVVLLRILVAAPTTIPLLVVLAGGLTAIVRLARRKGAFKAVKYVVLIGLNIVLPLMYVDQLVTAILKLLGNSAHAVAIWPCAVIHRRLLRKMLVLLVLAQLWGVILAVLYSR